MKTLVLAALTMVTVAAATPADAQRLVGAPMVQGPMAQGNVQHWSSQQPQRQQVQNRSRWGGMIGGHWYAGVNAPGGWNGYRRLHRGRTLPSYWIGAGFYLGDYAAYGLSRPSAGYSWSRYYDDAVLIDQRGKVWDSVSGIDWSRGDYGYGYAQGGAGGAGGYASGGYGYAQGGSGGYGTSYSTGQSYQEPQVVYAQPSEVVQQDYIEDNNSQSVTQGQGGYISNGYYYPPATTSTVTIEYAPVTTTTTTTDYVDVTRSYVAPRRVYRAPRKQYRVVRRRCSCSCCG